MAEGQIITEGAVAAPASVDEFRVRLAAVSADLPRRLRQCADYIAANTDRIAVSTVAELAAGAEVPPSALMRFCQILGFSGFSEMQRLFREAYSPGWPDYSTRLKNLKDEGAGSPSALLAEFIEAGRLSLEALAKTADEAALMRSGRAAWPRPRRCMSSGLRRAFPVATYLAYVFEKMSVPAMLHDGVGKLDHRFALRPGDAVLAITFAPYSEETLALAQDARDAWPARRGADRPADQPACPAADAVLTVPEVDFGAFRSLSATIAMAICAGRGGRFGRDANGVKKTLLLSLKME